MGKVCCAIIVLFLAMSSFGQSDGTASLKGYVLRLTLAPDFTYRTMKQDTERMTDDLWETLAPRWDSLHSAATRYSVGIGVSRAFSRKLYATLDVLYSRRAYHSLPGLVVYGTEETMAALTRRFSYVDVPLKLDYGLNYGKVQVLVGFGFTFNFSLGSSYYAEPTDATSSIPAQTYSTVYRRRAVNYSPTVSVGAAYSMNNKQKIIVQPTYSKMLLPEWYDTYAIEPSGLVTGGFEIEHLWKVGINITYVHAMF